MSSDKKTTGMNLDFSALEQRILARMDKLGKILDQSHGGTRREQDPSIAEPDQAEISDYMKGLLAGAYSILQTMAEELSQTRVHAEALQAALDALTPDQRGAPDPTHSQQETA